MRGGGARSRIAPRVFSTRSCEEFPKAAGAALNRRHRPVPIANELRRGGKKVSWASIAAIQLQGCRAAQAFARATRSGLRFSETAQPLRARQASDRAQLRRLVAAGWSLYTIVCVNRAKFNPYDAGKHLRTVRELAYSKTLASQPASSKITRKSCYLRTGGH